MRLCLGTVQLGMKYGIQGGSMPNDFDALSILNHAYENGVMSFDTAPSYGKAEKILSEFINQETVIRSDVEIISKFSGTLIHGIDSEMYKRIMISEIQKSLSNLNTEYLDGYLFHKPEHIFNRDAVNALISLKGTPFVKRVGVSIYTPEEAMAALEYEGLDIIQIPYNILDQRLDQCGFFEKTKKSKVSIYARSPLLQGLLTMPTILLRPSMEFAKTTINEFHDECTKFGSTPFEIAIKYVLGHDAIDVMVFGVDNITQLDEYISLSNDKSDEINKAFRGKWNKIDKRIIMPNIWPKD